MGWEERVWGYTGGGGMIQGFAAGYFLWDLGICSWNLDVFGWGLWIHAVAALVVFSFGFVSGALFLCLGGFDIRLGKGRGGGDGLVRCSYGCQGLICGVMVTASVCQLLRPNFHPLRAFVALSQLPLVLR